MRTFYEIFIFSKAKIFKIRVANNTIVNMPFYVEDYTPSELEVRHYDEIISPCMVGVGCNE